MRLSALLFLSLFATFASQASEPPPATDAGNLSTAKAEQVLKDFAHSRAQAVADQSGSSAAATAANRDPAIESLIHDEKLRGQLEQAALNYEIGALTYDFLDRGSNCLGRIGIFRNAILCRHARIQSHITSGIWPSRYYYQLGGLAFGRENYLFCYWNLDPRDIPCILLSVFSPRIQNQPDRRSGSDWLATTGPLEATLRMVSPRLREKAVVLRPLLAQL
jgi:hypothetical protein